MIGSLWKIHYIVTKLISSLCISWQNAGTGESSARYSEFFKVIWSCWNCQERFLITLRSIPEAFMLFSTKIDGKGREGDLQLLMIIVIFISFVIGENTKPLFRENYYILHPKRSKQIQFLTGTMAFFLVLWWEKVMVKLNYYSTWTLFMRRR